MLASVRAGAVAALVTLASTTAFAADKPFQRDELADSAIKLEARIKAEAGTVAKPLATLRRDVDAATARREFRSVVQLLGQIVTVAPNEAANWLRLARASMQVLPSDERERTTLLERASIAAYIAYQRARHRNDEPHALGLRGRGCAARKLWRPALHSLQLSLALRNMDDVRALYEQMRAQHGFRLLDYSVDSDAASPRICFQFSEALAGRRTDYAPFVAVAG